MTFYDFQLNIPLHLLTTKLPDQFITVYYGYEDRRVYLSEFGIGPTLAKWVKDWDQLESLAQSVAEQREAEKTIEIKANLDEIFEDLKHSITY